MIIVESSNSSDWLRNHDPSIQSQSDNAADSMKVCEERDGDSVTDGDGESNTDGDGDFRADGIGDGFAEAVGGFPPPSPVETGVRNLEGQYGFSANPMSGTHRKHEIAHDAVRVCL
jgi:hypothetical protein